MDFLLFFGLLFSLFILVIGIRFLIIVPSELSKISNILRMLHLHTLGYDDDDSSDDEFDNGIRFL